MTEYIYDHLRRERTGNNGNPCAAKSSDKNIVPGNRNYIAHLFKVWESFIEKKHGSLIALYCQMPST